MDGELAFALKSLLGDINVVSVPKPWDNYKFSFEPATLEEAVRNFFEDLKRGEDKMAREFPMPSQS